MKRTPSWQNQIIERLTDIDKTLAKQEQHLADHIRRTQLAEENISLLREELKPINKHINMMEGALKLVGILSLVAGFLATIFQLVKPLLSIGN